LSTILTMQENNESIFKKLQQELRSLVVAADSQQRVSAIKAFLEKWNSITPELDALVKVEIINLLNTTPDKQNSEARALLHVLVVDVLSKHSIPLPIEDEIKLLYLLSAETPAPGDDWSAIRLQRATWWLRTWSRIDKEKDSNYNPADMPALNVSPPGASGMPSGVDPAAIANPGLRNEYMKAIDQNREKTVYYNHQYTLRRLEPEFKKMAAIYLVDLYSKKPLAAAEITRLLVDWLPGRSEAATIIDAINKQTAP